MIKTLFFLYKTKKKSNFATAFEVHPYDGIKNIV